MSMAGEPKIYTDGDHELEGVLYIPNNLTGQTPTVLVFHAFLGLSDHEKNVAHYLSSLGFIAFAADVYGKGIKYTTREEGFAALKEYLNARSTLLRGRLLAALNFVKSIPEVDHNKISSIGFCFGGLCSLDLARINCGITSAVSFHGAYYPIEGETEFDKMEPIKAKLLIAHGDEDTHVNSTVDSFLEELRQRKADFQFIRYAFAKHGFTMSSHKYESIPGVGYDENADKRSKKAMLVLFNELYDLPKLDL